MTLAWETQGPAEAPAIVFSHSLGLDSRSWAPQISALADRFRLVTVDLPGHGRSPGTSSPLTLEMLARSVLDAAAQAGVAKFHLCGMSLSGQIALWTALHARERLRSIIAANTAARIGTVASWAERAASVRRGGMDVIVEPVMSRLFSPDFRQRDPVVYAESRAALQACDPESYVACCEVLGASDLTSEVGTIDLPCLVIGGELDPSTPPDLARRLHEQIRGSELVVIEGAAHASNLDRPETFTSTLDSFIARLDP